MLLKTNEWIRRENLWIKLHIRLIKIKSHLVVPILIINFAPATIFHMSRVCKIPCWNHISDSHTMLKPYNQTCWQLTLLHPTDVHSFFNVYPQPSSNFIFFFRISRTPQILKISRYYTSCVISWEVKLYHYEKLEHVILMITWNRNADIGRRAISGLNHIITSVANDVVNLLNLDM